MGRMCKICAHRVEEEIELPTPELRGKHANHQATHRTPGTHIFTYSYTAGAIYLGQFYIWPRKPTWTQFCHIIQKLENNLAVDIMFLFFLSGGLSDFAGFQRLIIVDWIQSIDLRECIGHDG